MSNLVKTAFSKLRIEWHSLQALQIVSVKGVDEKILMTKILRSTVSCFQHINEVCSR